MHEKLPDQPEIEKPQQSFKLIDNPWEVLKDLQLEIDREGEGGRVWLKGLDFQAGEFAKEVLPNLTEAADRNIDVRILHNPLSLYRTQGVPSYVRHIPFYPNRVVIADTYESTGEMLEKIERESRIKLKHTRPETKMRQFFPYAGADHQKIWIVGDTAYFGDFNLEDETFFNMQGFMVKIKDPEFVEALAKICIEPPKDRIIPITGDTFLVYDSGKRGESPIYDFTNYLVKGAMGGDEIFASLPLLPGHELLHNLDSALKRGASVKAVASRQKVYRPAPPVYISNRLAAKGIIRSGSDLRFRFAPEGGLHGKSWHFRKEGQLGVWFGSHNEVKSGIRAGTAELNMYSVNPELAGQVETYHERLWEASRTSKRMYTNPE